MATVFLSRVSMRVNAERDIAVANPSGLSVTLW